MRDRFFHFAVLAVFAFGATGCAGQPFLRIQINPQPILGAIGFGGTVKVPVYVTNSPENHCAVICLGDACLFVPNDGQPVKFEAELDAGYPNYGYHGYGTWSGRPRSLTVTASGRICQEVRYRDNGMPFACIGETVVRGVPVTLSYDPYHQVLPSMFLRWDQVQGYHFSPH